MSNIQTLPPFPIFLCETNLSARRMPHALASVEYEGTTWLLRYYEGLLFFKREEDTQGDAIFVLTEESGPTPEDAIWVWEEFFPCNGWARFGIRSWKGGYDWGYGGKMQHDMCFILPEETGPELSGLRITTDLSYGDYFGELPEELNIDTKLLTFLRTDFKVVSRLSDEERVKILLNSPLENILSEFSTDKQQEWLISRMQNRVRVSAKDKKAEQWLEETPYLVETLIDTFPVWKVLSLSGKKEEFEHLLRCACLVYPPSADAHGNHRLTVYCQTPFLAAQCIVKSHKRDESNIPDSLKELCDIILDYFEPKGHSYEHDHETSFGSFVPHELKVEFSPLSSGERMEAVTQLKEWLQSKGEEAAIEKLLSPVIE